MAIQNVVLQEAHGNWYGLPPGHPVGQLLSNRFSVRGIPALKVLSVQKLKFPANLYCICLVIDLLYTSADAVKNNGIIKQMQYKFEVNFGTLSINGLRQVDLYQFKSRFGSAYC